MKILKGEEKVCKFDKSSVKINNACQAKKVEEEVRT